MARDLSRSGLNSRRPTPDRSASQSGERGSPVSLSRQENSLSLASPSQRGAFPGRSSRADPSGLLNLPLPEVASDDIPQEFRFDAFNGIDLRWTALGTRGAASIALLNGALPRDVADYKGLSYQEVLRRMAVHQAEVLIFFPLACVPILSFLFHLSVLLLQVNAGLVALKERSEEVRVPTRPASDLMLQVAELKHELSLTRKQVEEISAREEEAIKQASAAEARASELQRTTAQFEEELQTLRSQKSLFNSVVPPAETFVGASGGPSVTLAASTASLTEHHCSHQEALDALRLRVIELEKVRQADSPEHEDFLNEMLKKPSCFPVFRKHLKNARKLGYHEALSYVLNNLSSEGIDWSFLHKGRFAPDSEELELARLDPLPNKRKTDEGSDP